MSPDANRARYLTAAGVGKYPAGSRLVSNMDIHYRAEGFMSETAAPSRGDLESAARAYMNACGIQPTPDAVEQQTDVFLKCLRIMCERPWDPNGGTWRRSGRFGILSDVRKKFERLWERGWRHARLHDDSGFDLINYVGFYLRSSDSEWGEWGPPGQGKL
jgi:hypothetical protein